MLKSSPNCILQGEEDVQSDQCVVTNVEQTRAHGIWPDNQEAGFALFGENINFDDMFSANKKGMVILGSPPFL